MSLTGFEPQPPLASRPRADVAAILDVLGDLRRHPLWDVRTLFDGCDRLVLTRAPGRLDVMGGIADYSGARVLEWPIAEAVVCVAGVAADSKLRIVSLGADNNNRSASFEMPLNELLMSAHAGGYQAVRARLRAHPPSAWAAYVAGAFAVLAKENRVAFVHGVRLLIASEVLEGRGLSSSAALEVAALTAVAALVDLQIEAPELARLAQIVENEVVGAPCGLMDQMTSTCGRERQFLSMVCQPANLEPPVSLPEGLGVWGIDSGVRHSVGGHAYGDVRVAAFMGYRMLADLAGFRVQPGPPGRVRVDDPQWQGYLANVAPEHWQRVAPELPETMLGDAFLAQFHGITDAVTHVHPERLYPVRAATGHPILEHARVTAFAAALRREHVDQAALIAMGELMYQSHASYAACGLDCQQTAQLVQMVRAEGPSRGLYGAKITGGGSGGTVAVLGDASAAGLVAEIAARYAKASGMPAHVTSGSSPGADAFGRLWLERRPA